jgi:hypothetical protein
MNPQTESSQQGSPLPNATSSLPAPASPHSEPNTTVVKEKPHGDWSSANLLCAASTSFIDPVFLLFGEAGDDDNMPGEALVTAESGTCSSLTGEDMSPVTETAEQTLSPGYQKRGRFLIWPTTLGGPLALHSS